MIANFTALFLYPEISRQLTKKRDLFFFCHAWSFGGAERVHIDILNLFRAQNPICFITDRSKNEGFRKEFEAAADVINLGRWTEKNSYKQHLHKKIARTINSEKQPVVLGCNSRFMYELIPYLEPHVKVVDLIHNFSDHNEGAEWYSVPYIPRLNNRIIVGKTLIKQFTELYHANQIPAHYLERLVVIQNKTQFDNFFPEKNYEDRLQILFVARNSPEKRVETFIRIAQLSEEKNLPVDFKMIGNFNPEQNNLPLNTQIIGEVHDKNTLNEHYKKAHLLLLTSQREGWGLVIFEGMNMGVVPIATNVSELSNYISREKENGIVVENLDNTEDLALQFIKEITFFVINRTQLKEFSMNAFNTMKQLSDNCDFDEAYRKVLSSQPDNL